MNSPPELCTLDQCHTPCTQLLLTHSRGDIATIRYHLYDGTRSRSARTTSSRSVSSRYHLYDHTTSRSPRTTSIRSVNSTHKPIFHRTEPAQKPYLPSSIRIPHLPAAGI